MLMGHDELCALIPHSGTMCLLETVLEWQTESIVCTARSQCQADNPLRRDGVLSVVHGIEYAAQAMAVHGGLLARERGESNPAGFLAAVRDVRWQVESLHPYPELRVEAHEQMRSGGSFIYEFSVSAEGQTLLSGRATVMSQQGEE
jgi:predicted hotdog family 3-hydroxylacyl-ACP dehydratase